MYFDTAEGPVFRPPSEAHSFILRVTIGCSHNRCTYCNMYREVQFRVRSMAEVMVQIHQAARYKEQVRKIFLADGNALVLETKRLLEILSILRDTFPKLQRVSCYAGPKDILRKSPEELQALYQAGLKLVYYGMESGDDEVLLAVNKGVNGRESIEAGQRIIAAGMKLSMMVILGLAGRDGSAQHAARTAEAVNQICPTMLSALTLMMYRGSELREQYEQGQFALLSPQEIMGELYQLLEQIHLPSHCRTIFRSNHISNYANFAGNLPQDKERLLTEVAKAQQALQGLTEWDPYNNVEA